MIPPVSAWMHSESFVGLLLGFRGKMESFSRAWRCDCKLWPRFLDDPVLICSSSSATTSFCFATRSFNIDHFKQNQEWP